MCRPHRLCYASPTSQALTCFSNGVLKTGHSEKNESWDTCRDGAGLTVQNKRFVRPESLGLQTTRGWEGQSYQSSLSFASFRMHSCLMLTFSKQSVPMPCVV